MITKKDAINYDLRYSHPGARRFLKAVVDGLWILKKSRGETHLYTFDDMVRCAIIAFEAGQLAEINK